MTAKPEQTFFLDVATDDGLTEMELEQYIVGVVAAEMPASFEEEALKAQAVAARTYTVKKMLNGGCSKGNGDICTDSSHCQACVSEEEMRRNWGENYTDYHEKICLAVQQTAGQVLSFEGEVIEALFHSSSDGSTEACVNVFSQDLPYLQAVSTPENVEQSEVCYDADRFIALCEQQIGDCGLKKQELDTQVEVLSRYESGRVEMLKVGDRQISGKQARTIFSLRSASFSVKTENGQIVFSVSGYGHGVGMSQWGANTLAEQGSDCAQILSHYYTGTTLALAEEFLGDF